MKYTIRATRHGRVIEAHCGDLISAVTFFEALFDRGGYDVQLWMGAEQIR
jgi:hypothetical protein